MPKPLLICREHKSHGLNLTESVVNKLLRNHKKTDWSMVNELLGTKMQLPRRLRTTLAIEAQSGTLNDTLLEACLIT